MLGITNIDRRFLCGPPHAHLSVFLTSLSGKLKLGVTICAARHANLHSLDLAYPLSVRSLRYYSYENEDETEKPTPVDNRPKFSTALVNFS